jgi:HEPN domain-containing protein
MPRRKHVELMLTKAGEDERTLDILMRDAEAPVTSMGFSAQQAAEKLLKAAIKAAGADYPLTHNIRALLELARQSGAEVPEGLWALDLLTPFAAQFRYDALPGETGVNLDIQPVRSLLRDLRAWVEGFVEARNWGEGGG